MSVNKRNQLIRKLSSAVEQGKWSKAVDICSELEEQEVRVAIGATTVSAPRAWSIRLVKAIYERDDGRCIYCGGYASEIDHVIPVSWGGPATMNNGVCCCHKCNSKKSNKPNMNMITRGIFWLMQADEDMRWVDNFSPRKVTRSRKLKR